MCYKGNIKLNKSITSLHPGFEFALPRCLSPLVKCFVCLRHSPGGPALGETKNRKSIGTSSIILHGLHRM